MKQNSRVTVSFHSAVFQWSVSVIAMQLTAISINTFIQIIRQGKRFLVAQVVLLLFVVQL